MISPKQARDMLQSLANFDATDGLSEWESSFVESQTEYADNNGYERLSVKVFNKIEELYNRRIVKDDQPRFHERGNKS